MNPLHEQLGMILNHRLVKTAKNRTKPVSPDYVCVRLHLIWDPLNIRIGQHYFQCPLLIPHLLQLCITRICHRASTNTGSVQIRSRRGLVKTANKNIFTIDAFHEFAWKFSFSSNQCFKPYSNVLIRWFSLFARSVMGKRKVEAIYIGGGGEKYVVVHLCSVLFVYCATGLMKLKPAYYLEEKPYMKAAQEANRKFFWWFEWGMRWFDLFGILLHRQGKSLGFLGSECFEVALGSIFASNLSFSYCFAGVSFES